MSSIQKSADTQTHILDAAWDLISKEGAEVSLQDIAAAAGVSRQAIYLHFGSRGGLLMAMVKRADIRFEIEERLLSCLQIHDPYERLEKSIAIWIDFVLTIYPVASDLIRLRDTDESAANAWEDRMTDLRGWLKILITSLNKDGALLPAWKTQEAADYLWVAFSVQVWGLLTRDCHWSAKKAAKVLARAITRSLLKDPC